MIEVGPSAPPIIPILELWSIAPAASAPSKTLASVTINEMKAYPIWNEQTKTLTVYKDDRCIIFEADNPIVRIDSNVYTVTAPIFEKGNLFVPYDEFFAVMNYIVSEGADKIVCTSKAVEGFEISASATGYGDNMVIDYDKAVSGDFAFSNIPTTIKTEVVDGKTVLVLEPTSTTGLFSAVNVNSGGKKVSLSSIVAKGGKMKVSFSYKGVCTSMRVENREPSTLYQNETISTVSENEWNTFEHVFDNKDFLDTTSARWLTIRVTSAENQAPKVYIADFKIQCLESVDYVSF